MSADTAKLIARGAAGSDLLRSQGAHLSPAERRSIANSIDALADALAAAETILHPKDEEHLGKLIAALRAQVELDEDGYCVALSDALHRRGDTRV